MRRPCLPVLETAVVLELVQALLDGALFDGDVVDDVAGEHERPVGRPEHVQELVVADLLACHGLVGVCTRE